MSIAEFVKERRKKLGMTQVTLADRAGVGFVFFVIWSRARQRCGLIRSIRSCRCLAVRLPLARWIGAFMRKGEVFLSDDFKSRLGKLVAAHLKVLEDV